MAVISMKQLLEAGVHFGHQTRRWNPKMKKIYLHWKKWYLYHRLTKTVKKVDEAYNFLKQVSEDGGQVLFVGTKNKHKNQLNLKQNVLVNSTLTKDG